MNTQAIDAEFIKSNDETKMRNNQEIMTGSIISLASSLSSPVDSGVQLLDSESEMTSVMSNSGTGYDIDALDTDSDSKSLKLIEKTSLKPKNHSEINHYVHKVDVTILRSDLINSEGKRDKIHVMTKSDIANQNINHIDLPDYSKSVPNSDFLIACPEKSDYDEKVSDLNIYYMNVGAEHAVYEELDLKQIGRSLSNLELSPKIKKPENDVDSMNVSLNSYELLDYTLQNSAPVSESDMHVSLSEEVNETLTLSLGSSNNAAGGSGEKKVDVEEDVKSVQEMQPACDEQIVFRRQRKKKSKSDTPKKRVSFHEDILNSTKIDDIHINHGFITHEPDVSISFFQRGFIRKPDVVKGRYSWAAEGDAPYYEGPPNNREVKSDIYIHNARFSSTSSSSSASISSSVDEEETTTDDTFVKREPTFSKPKSSCLKKKPKKKCIKTDIVEEETGLHKKKSETNLLDSNIFGNLKNILNFSTSVPLAERGVPEGQEDIAIYSSSHDLNFKTSRRSSNPNLRLKAFDYEEPVQVKKPDLSKVNLKLTKSEGFYPNYPPQNVPSNILLCDSNVYEHKGISYSYEYDNFQKSFEQQKPKSSTLYQMILKEFNFFKRKAKQEPEPVPGDDFEIVEQTGESNETKKDTDSQKPNKYASTTKMDWSDNDTIVSDYTENTNSRHLNSPKRKISKPNHYSIQQSFKYESDSKSDLIDANKSNNLRVSSSKTSLINRFLRNVTMKKLLDMKLQKKQQSPRKYMSLYVNVPKLNEKINENLDREIEEEIIKGQEAREKSELNFERVLLKKFKSEIFRNCNEVFLKAFPVHSTYTTSGQSKPLLVILTNTTLYISGYKHNLSYFNHFVLPYTELNTVLIGPNGQTIHFSNYDKDMQFIVLTGCTNITSSIAGQLEMATRKDANKPQLPAVKQINMRDMANLRRAICKQTAVEADEEYFHYSVINCQEYNTDTVDTPLGPNKEGPLMFKVMENDTRWETAYFILKAGVLYMLSSPTHRVPMRVLPLINGACQGARRIINCPRPHTFQLTIGSTILHLAAPDEYVASDWLQALVQAASGTYNQKEKILAPSCSLLMTTDHILTVREAFPCSISTLISSSAHDPIKGAQALSCATILDLTAFRLPSAEHSWCVLEFACREVHEISGDWILYFATNAELENFISTLEVLWNYNNEQGDSFPLSTIPETDPLSKRCSDTYRALQNSWPTLQLTPQSF